MMSPLSVKSQEVRVRYVLQSFVFLLSSILLLPFAARAQANPDWHRAIQGFKIAGNLYYVGTADLAASLIATPQGNILINGNAVTPFIDPAGYRAYAAEREQAFEKELAKQTAAARTGDA